MVTKWDKPKENSLSFTENIEIIEKLSFSISTNNRARETGNALKKILERINELNNVER